MRLSSLSLLLLFVLVFDVSLSLYVLDQIDSADSLTVNKTTRMSEIK